MKRKLQILASLAMAQRWRLAMAWLWLPVFSLALRVISVPTIQRWMIRKVAARDSTHPSAKAWVSAVEVAGRHHLYPMRCLERSLTLQFLLSWLGQPSELKIGVRRTENELEAHAWLELDGCPLNDPPEVIRRYRALSSAGAAR